MTRRAGERDINVTEIELDHGVSAGVSLRLLGNGLAPVFEVEDARQENRISIQTWYFEMSEMERALIIARRRIDRAMKNLQTEAEIKKAEREANKNRKR